jgi:hypothetical protein
MKNRRSASAFLRFVYENGKPMMPRIFIIYEHIVPKTIKIFRELYKINSLQEIAAVV